MMAAKLYRREQHVRRRFPVSPNGKGLPPLQANPREFGVPEDEQRSSQDGPLHAANSAPGLGDIALICQCLRASRYRELQDLQVIRHGDTIAVKGRVSSYYMKQMAQETIRKFIIGKSFENQILVIRKPR